MKLNESEKKLKNEAESRGYGVLRMTRLDFLLYKDDRAFFVEVKTSSNSKLRDTQKRAKEVFESLGIPVLKSVDGKWVEPDRFNIPTTNRLKKVMADNKILRQQNEELKEKIRPLKATVEELQKENERLKSTEERMYDSQRRSFRKEAGRVGSEYLNTIR